jgi:hypothetical protein
MPKKQKQSLSHLRCREAVGLDSIAPGMIHQMLYLSANVHPQYANVGEKSIVQHQNTGTPKPLANSTECDAAWENPNTALWPKIRSPKLESQGKRETLGRVHN